MKPTHIILHHSLTKDSGTVSWNAIRRYHVHRLGWDYIGYHWGIELVGDRYESLMGRLPNMTGAHCRQARMNHLSWGICLVGNFDKEPPDPTQLMLAKNLVRSLMEIGDIPKHHILMHREFAHYKTCPGILFPFEKFVDSL